MSAINAKTILDILAGKDVPVDKAKEYVRLYVDHFGRGENPWSPVDNPDEYNAWPTNNEMGALFIKHMRREAVNVVKERRGYEYDQERQAAIDNAAADL